MDKLIGIVEDNDNNFMSLLNIWSFIAHYHSFLNKSKLFCEITIEQLHDALNSHHPSIVFQNLLEQLLLKCYPSSQQLNDFELKINSIVGLMENKDIRCMFTSNYKIQMASQYTDTHYKSLQYQTWTVKDKADLLVKIIANIKETQQFKQYNDKSLEKISKKQKQKQLALDKKQNIKQIRKQYNQQIQKLYFNQYHKILLLGYYNKQFYLFIKELQYCVLIFNQSTYKWRIIPSQEIENIIKYLLENSNHQDSIYLIQNLDYLLENQLTTKIQNKQSSKTKEKIYNKSQANGFNTIQNIILETQSLYSQMIKYYKGKWGTKSQRQQFINEVLNISSQKQLNKIYQKLRYMVFNINYVMIQQPGYQDILEIDDQFFNQKHLQPRMIVKATMFQSSKKFNVINMLQYIESKISNLDELWKKPWIHLGITIIYQTLKFKQNNYQTKKKKLSKKRDTYEEKQSNENSLIQKYQKNLRTRHQKNYGISNLLIQKYQKNLRTRHQKNYGFSNNSSQELNDKKKLSLNSQSSKSNRNDDFQPYRYRK